MVATLLPRVSSSRRLLTADLAALPDPLPSGSVKWELLDGELVQFSPPTDAHSVVSGRLVGHLVQAEFAGWGEARGEVGIVLRRNPDRVVGADAAFILTASLPVTRSQEGYLETIPEIVVEIRSKNDTNPEVDSKTAEYHRAGVVEVWVIDSDTRTVGIRRANQPEAVFPDSATLASALLPGFAVPVANLFVGS